MNDIFDEDGQPAIPMEPRLEEATKILGAQLFELHVLWQQYRQLYADPSTIEVLNRTAGMFFRIVQDQLWDSVLLGICRMIDRPTSMGRPNLTLRSLPLLITDDALRGEVEAACSLAVTSTEFARNHRNKRIAHQDHDYATNPALLEADGISRQKVEEMLAALRNVMQLIDHHYNSTDVQYSNTIGVVSGADRLIAALRQRERYRQQLLSGSPS